MPLRRATFLWGRGVSAERLQAYRIAGALNGVNVDEEVEKRKEQVAIVRTGKPSAEAQAILDAIMAGEDDGSR